MLPAARNRRLPSKPLKAKVPAALGAAIRAPSMHAGTDADQDRTDTRTTLIRGA